MPRPVERMPSQRSAVRAIHRPFTATRTSRDLEAAVLILQEYQYGGPTNLSKSSSKNKPPSRAHLRTGCSGGPLVSKNDGTFKSGAAPPGADGEGERARARAKQIGGKTQQETQQQLRSPPCPGDPRAAGVQDSPFLVSLSRACGTFQVDNCTVATARATPHAPGSGHSEGRKLFAAARGGQ